MMRKLGIRDGAENGSIRPIDDHRALAVLTLIISQGILTMPAALARALGAEDVGPEVLRRLTGPALELFTHGVYADDSVIRRATNAWAAAPPEPAHQERNSRMAIHRGHLEPLKALTLTDEVPEVHRSVEAMPWRAGAKFTIKHRS